MLRKKNKYFSAFRNPKALGVTNAGNLMFMKNTTSGFNRWLVRLTLAFLLVGAFVGGYGFMALVAQLLRW